MRRSPLIALLAGVVLISAGLLATAGALVQERQQERTLQRDADQVALGFASYFERARSLDLLLAQSPALRPSAGHGVDNDAANQALGYLQELYPGAIGEACLTDERGHELASVVEGAPIAVKHLSVHKKKSAFFHPTLTLDPGQVHQAAPYVSKATKKWVISNATWIRQADGKPLIVHFEVALDTFHRYLANSSANRHVAIVDRRTGRVVLQDGVALPTATKASQFPKFPAAAALKSGPTRPGAIDVDGHRAAASNVAHTGQNANDWVVVEWSTANASFLPAWVGGAAAALGAGLVLFFLVVLRRQQSAWRMAARLDHLTGMSNRMALEEALEEAVLDAAASGRGRVAVLILDLDSFKQINDTLGHDRGDLVLQEVGRRLHANTFEYDTAARLGGDEFAVILRQLRDVDDVAAVAHRLREALIRPIEIDGVARFIGVSVGASIYGDHGRSSDELLRAADAAMYEAKKGRDGVRVYDAGTAAGANASGLAAELLLAIENEELELVFQPEYALDTDEIVGIEALARWRRGGDADIPPSEFIPLAEQTGLIRQLTHLTLRKALDQARVWHEAGVAIPVSVNLSAQLAADRSMRADVSHMLDERGLSGAALVLEITENTVIKELEVAIEVLQSMRSIGVRVELDDFGSGYASFKALYELPLDGVKIDRALVNDLSTGGQLLLAATIDIARRLGLKVVAEGIEDMSSLELVRSLGSDTAQGYHLARPMSSEALRFLLTRVPAELSEAVPDAQQWAPSR